MQYVIKAVGTNAYYSFRTKHWSMTPMGATKFGYYNPFRFILKVYLSLKYGPMEFYRLVPLKANVSLFGKIK